LHSEVLLMDSGQTPKSFNLFIVNPAPDAERIQFSVSTPRALPVLAAATPNADYIRKIRLVDQSLEDFPFDEVQPGDLVGLSVYTSNVIYAYQMAEKLRERGVTVVFGGPHASIMPDEVSQHGDACVTGDAELVWGELLDDYSRGEMKKLYKGGRVDPESFTPARWDLMDLDKYLMASVQTVRGCPKQCTFCSVWVQDGQSPRVRANDAIIEEVKYLYQAGFRVILFADDNFYPYTIQAINAAEGEAKEQLTNSRQDRLDLLTQITREVPDDMKFVTQITIEVAEDPEYLAAMKAARIVGVLIGIEAVTPEGLKDTNKEWNFVGDELVEKLNTIRQDGSPFILGSIIFGLESDTPESLDYTKEFARTCGIALAQFVPMVPFPGTVDFALMKRGKKTLKLKDVDYDYWLDPDHPRILYDHPNMNDEVLLQKVENAWSDFYSISSIMERSRGFGYTGWKAHLAFLVLSRGLFTRYRRHGLSSESAVRGNKKRRFANLLGRVALKLMKRPPAENMPVSSTLQAHPAKTA
jgi:radical SAM superfamily enzyme YgiQ (UPF0313 family)